VPLPSNPHASPQSLPPPCSRAPALLSFPLPPPLPLRRAPHDRPWSSNSGHSRPPPWKAQISSVFFVGQLKRMQITSLLLSPPSILSEMNSNLRILRDFIFQLNSDFISNSNLNPSGLLPHPYISLGAPPHASPYQFPIKAEPYPPPKFHQVACARRRCHPCSKTLPSN
jgi:hypothetical protein